MRNYLVIIINLFTFVLSSLSATADVKQFTLLTYAISGFPSGLSQSNPTENIPIISAKSNNYDIVLVQEDFVFHDKLLEFSEHKQSSEPYQTSPFDRGDGLNRLVNFSFEPVYRQAWRDCHGYSRDYNDCLTSKGFSIADTEIELGVFITIINLHLDRGNTRYDKETRTKQIQQLLWIIELHSFRYPLLIAGNFNLYTEDSRLNERKTLEHLLEKGNLTDVCHELRCGIEKFERVLYRNSETVKLSPISWNIPDGFYNDAGEPLSEHQPLEVTFNFSRHLYSD